jgi:molecular chaperone DnaJ
VFRLNRQGMPRLRRRGRGDLLVEVDVLVPTDLTKEQEEALRTYGGLRGEEPAGKRRKRRFRAS